MTQREKVLAGAVAAAGLLWFGTQGLAQYRTAREQNFNQQIQAEQKLSEAKAALNRGQHARRQLNKWNHRSLPTNQEIAESLYQDWLRGQLTDAGLQVTQLSDRTGYGRNPQYHELSFEVRAEGSLADLTKFLHQFYSAVHLHRISSATLTRKDNGQKLDVTMTVDALILPGCDRTDKLAEGEPQPLPATQEEFRQRVVDRNIFAAYSPSASPERGTGGGAAATITGMYYGLTGWVMTVRSGDSKVLRTFEQGDSIEFGELKGTVAEIDGRRAVIETENGRMEVRLGQNFSDAVPLQPPAA